MRKFLTAKWQDLIMVNYEVDPAILATRLPTGTTIDLNEGRCFVSLVGFRFLETRVMGVPVPFHINFEEVNLRFYVVRETPAEVRRGVCFIKEIVPRYAIAAIARILYGEPYECWRMEHTRSAAEIGYSWINSHENNKMHVSIGPSLGVPAEGSHAEFIIEHYWGYTKRNGTRVDEYKVEHPKWELYSIKDHLIDVDFGATYGNEFAFLTGATPYSVLSARGSEIAVYKGERIT
jgi:uncharacterized protein